MQGEKRFVLVPHARTAITSSVCAANSAATVARGQSSTRSAATAARESSWCGEKAVVNELRTADQEPGGGGEVLMTSTRVDWRCCKRSRRRPRCSCRCVYLCVCARNGPFYLPACLACKAPVTKRVTHLLKAQSTGLQACDLR